MSASLTNLKQSLVTEEIETVLDNYPHHPYQQAFAAPHLRHQLTAYVLNQVPAEYRIIEDQQELGEIASFQEGCSGLERCHVEALIRRGIQHVLQENADWACRHIPETEGAGDAPSHWFG